MQTKRARLSGHWSRKLPLLCSSRGVPLAVATASAHGVLSFRRGPLGNDGRLARSASRFGGVFSHQRLLAVGAVATGQLMFRVPGGRIQLSDTRWLPIGTVQIVDGFGCFRWPKPTWVSRSEVRSTLFLQEECAAWNWTVPNRWTYEASWSRLEW